MKKRVLLGLISTWLVASLLVGCGAGKEVNGEKKEEVSQEAGKEESVKKLNVAYMANYGSLWSILNAIDLGYFEEENMEINLIEFKDGPTIIAAMESGGIDIGYIGQGAHKLCINGKAKVFALSHISNADMLIGGPNVEAVEDLMGKKVAYVDGTSSEDILVKALARANMTINDIIAVNMPQEDIKDAIRVGGVEAVAIWSPYSLKILEEVEGTKKLADNLTFVDEGVSLSSWIVSPQYAEENMDTILRFTDALYRAMDYAATKNQEHTAQLIAEQIGEEAEAVYEQRGDAQWLTGKEVATGAKSGMVQSYYELQKQMFIDSGAVGINPDVDEYVMFDVMIKAGQYE